MLLSINDVARIKSYHFSPGYIITSKGIFLVISPDLSLPLFLNISYISLTISHSSLTELSLSIFLSLSLYLSILSLSLSTSRHGVTPTKLWWGSIHKPTLTSKWGSGDSTQNSSYCLLHHCKAHFVVNCI